MLGQEYHSTQFLKMVMVCKEDICLSFLIKESEESKTQQTHLSLLLLFYIYGDHWCSVSGK